MNNEDAEEKYRRIMRKIENNPKLKDEVDTILDRLCKIFESNVSVTLVDDDIVDKYENNVFDYYDDEMLDFDSNITLGEFIEVLSDERDMDLNIAIDPIYLEDGVNGINNLLLTTYEDKLILVPKKKKDE